ncbi:hypothetical protein A3F00_03565 [Candidatus Daviesbacteria bacterium RIFCSPHIGHO2_12_FULL_37_11]|uniref:Triosephosphate isomerase n=1 Tax=Candidatus Daviesbacteria bacterium RIFCSPHIGHO2_12_FULL_37_11 TaxID=1797777 RepID=A0A1F5KD49_9BACT|nr:MAG: hypothetical protein A2111_02750 [Candidatus Daviesbacteria bacterium GWA1_38_6]OGE18008.1 MAG: hypothetical protein A2769_01075 [Candidatus Daviesbacteria bacterium RIFCSPHIGHO2_01_FULL_37_27]OGE38720.1 MAG: hypothetical protein A3F00_03565 [Candidatus Daviesbacteria bacterium RIFCSPHIGHO2_12_FULL_37_11]OGE45809.1 MAG: hypothetical protein A3B39_01105 [Candidatus Daviesbacteria bacterium RIFCSPLOWO2_01_FULL_37_10]
MVGLETKNIWVIANWKSNKTVQEALEWISVVGPKLERRENIRVVVCPTFNCLSEVKKAITVGNFPLIVGSQDLSPFEKGAYTGEDPASILKQFIEVAIVGHSERRKNFGETDELVVQKVKQAIDNQIIPLVCVQGKETPVPEGVKLVAYEPVFAIGTGNPDTPENASSVAEFLNQKYGEDTEILYGGSVNSNNVESFISKDNINGVLVGGASLDPEKFIKIIEVCTTL